MNKSYTGREVELSADIRIVSRTDLKGNILEANSEFIEISGYEEHELMGKPHNILRHEDVPKAVFKDFWATIQAGKGWTQYVKNRCKNGDHYWVKANAGPIIENGEITGYLSVRTPITNEEKAIATDAYKAIEAGSLLIEEGRLYSPMQLRMSKFPFNHWSVMTKTVVMGAFLVMMGAIITGLLANNTYQQTVTENFKTLQKSLKSQLQFEVTQKKVTTLQTAIALAETPAIQQDLLNSQSKEASKTYINQLAKSYKAQANVPLKVHIHSPDGRSFLRSWSPDKSGDDLTSFRFTVNKVMQTQSATQALELGRAGVAIRSVVPVKKVTDGSYLGSVEVISGLQAIMQGLQAENVGYAAVLNDYAVTISTKAQDNPKLGEFRIAQKALFDAGLISKLQTINLDKLMSQGYLHTEAGFFVSAPISDLNDALVGYHLLFIDANEVNQINALAKNTAVQTLIKVVSALVIITLLFLLMLNFYITKPMKALRDVMQKSEKDGDLSLRANSVNRDEMGQLAQSYNNQMQKTQMVIGEANRMLSDIAHGNLNTETVLPMQKDFGVIKLNLNNAAQSMRSTMGSINESLVRLQEGDFSKQGSITLNGAYAEAVQSTYNVVETLQAMFTDINILMAQMAKGYFNQRLTLEAQGEFKRLEENINASLNTLEVVISETAKVMIAQGNGELTQRITSEVEGTLLILKEGVNNSAANIASLMAQSNYSVNKLSKGAVFLTEGMQKLSERTLEQSGSIEQTASGMEQVTSTVESTAENAKEASLVAEQSIRNAAQANNVVEQTIQAIEEIEQSSSKISEITALIDSIAFQTNLLALNAAVEAARAGEHGRGFAVVAGEVRSLAQKSADAAKDINQLINDTVNRVHHGAQMADKSGEALNVINDSINQISQFVSEISTNAQEQALGVHNINQAITAIDKMNQQNALMVQDSVRQTTEMNDVSQDVNKVMTAFKIDYQQIAFTEAMQSGDFEFARARQAHRAWKGLIHAYIENMDVEMNKQAATDHTKCGLGTWFYGPEGQAYANLAEMQTVEKNHMELHACISRIIQAHDIDDNETVQQELLNLDRLSEAVIGSLVLAEKAVNRTKAH